MAKIKRGNYGYQFVKEFGGARRRTSPSKPAQLLIQSEKIRGRVLDYGCGFGFDADHFLWEAYDPYYQQTKPQGKFDTIVCIHVAHMLTRKSRLQLYEEVDGLLSDTGVAYFSVARNIPRRGKQGLRKRIQNYVVLTLPTVYKDDELEIYEMPKGAQFEDCTAEFEDRMQ